MYLINKELWKNYFSNKKDLKGSKKFIVNSNNFFLTTILFIYPTSSSFDKWRDKESVDFMVGL